MPPTYPPAGFIGILIRTNIRKATVAVLLSPDVEFNLITVDVNKGTADSAQAKSQSVVVLRRKMEPSKVEEGRSSSTQVETKLEISSDLAVSWSSVGRAWSWGMLGERPMK